MWSRRAAIRDLGAKLAALGYTHVVDRRSQIAPAAGIPEAGLRLLAEFSDSRVYAVVAQIPPVVTLDADGFHDFEIREQDRWQWMGPEGRWQVRNTTSQARLVELAIELESVDAPRTLEISLDGAPIEQLRIPVRNSPYRLGPWRLDRGDHALMFRTIEPPFRASKSDRRKITIAFRNVRWIEPPPRSESAVRVTRPQDGGRELAGSADARSH